MASEDNPGIGRRALYMAKGGARSEAKLGHGPFGEYSDTYVDAKPYVAYYNDGIFEGYDGSVWMYFKLPEDVQTQWLLDPRQALENQAPFIELMKEFGSMLDSQTEKVRNDVRRNFHVQVTQVESTGIKAPEGSSAAHADYLSRISAQYVKPEWFGFIGVQILKSDIFYEAHGFTNKLLRYMDALRNPGSVRWTELRKDIDDVVRVMGKHGFGKIDFIDNPEYLEQLTAWHGIGDEQHALPRQLQNVRMKEPIQGLSIITPKWGEVQMAALRPMTGVNLKDPLSESSRWAVPLYNPGSNVVLINIRGQVRAPSIADNLLDLKRIKSRDKRVEEGGANASVVDAILLARTAVQEVKLPMLDNLEIVVGYVVPPVGVTNTLPAQMKLYGMEVAPLIGRQHLGVLSSFPTYPRKVLRVPRGNGKRPELSNVMLPGVVAMSGLFRSTKPCAPDGILMGLSDAGDEFKEVYTETDAASKYNKVPGMLVTGRPGAGKTQQLLQMTIQIAMRGLPVAFFNPKKEGTLQPTFDYIGGLTISMNRKYLEENPGMLDPFLFLDDRAEIGSLIADSIFTAGRFYDDAGSSAESFRTKIRTEIVERAKDPRNRSAHDVIFGNGHQDPRMATHPVSAANIQEFVTDRVKIAPFWRAFISRNSGASALRNKLKQGKSFLIEWDRGMSLPDIGTDPKDYKQDQLDTVISVNVTFAYASAIISGTGGAIIVDESWVLKSSREALTILERGGREWRQANIMLIMATQRIQDWMNAKAERNGAVATQNMATFFDRYLIMAIGESDPNEIDAFYDLTGQPRTERMTRYMTHAGATSAGGTAKGNSVPRAFYMDRIYGWEGGIVCGPWPQRELNLGRTDKEGIAARERAAIAAARPGAASAGMDDAAVHAPEFAGVLNTIRNEGLQRDEELAREQEERERAAREAAEAAQTSEPVPAQG